jgi:hypothetical protein
MATTRGQREANESTPTNGTRCVAAIVWVNEEGVINGQS